MKLWNDENEKFALMREKLYTPVVGDILDELGYYHQFLPQDIRPLREDMKLAGKAMTVRLISEGNHPGATEFTLIPSWAHSTASPLVMDSTAPLLVQ